MKLTTFVITITLAYWGFLFTMTHIPVEQVPHTTTSDKVLHLGAYAALAFWVNASLYVTKRWNRKAVMIGIGVLILFAGFDELTQLLVGRSAEWGDWRADLIGIFLGTITLAILIAIFQRSSFANHAKR